MRDATREALKAELDDIHREIDLHTRGLQSAKKLAAAHDKALEQLATRRYEIGQDLAIPRAGWQM